MSETPSEKKSLLAQRLSGEKTAPAPDDPIETERVLLKHRSIKKDTRAVSPADQSALEQLSRRLAKLGAKETEPSVTHFFNLAAVLSIMAFAVFIAVTLWAHLTPGFDQLIAAL